MSDEADLPRLILVTGSRVLTPPHSVPVAYVNPARSWLLDQITAFDPDVVVTGDARGPDSWSKDWCREHGSPNPMLRAYGLDGQIRREDGRPWCRWTDASPPAVDAGAALWGAWCLHRDRVMVRAVATRARRYGVLVVSLEALWSSTRGTAFTVARARRAGLEVRSSWWDRVAGQPRRADGPPPGWSPWDLPGATPSGVDPA